MCISENSLRFILNYEACKPLDVSAGKVDSCNLWQDIRKYPIHLSIFTRIIAVMG